MSDMGMYPPEEDPAVEELIYQMILGGWQPYGQQMNVPYAQEQMGGNTDPTRQWKSQDTILKSQKSLMGFSPIEAFAGPEPQLWVPGTEQLAEEIAGDQFGQQLIERLDAGEGIINLQRQIVNATYDPENDLGPTPEKPMAPQEAEVYLDWLRRYSKARSEDYVKLSQPGVVTDAAETDVMADLPTDEALNFNEEDFINKLRVGGAFGAQRKNPGSISNRPEALRRDFPSTPARPMGSRVSQFFQDVSTPEGLGRVRDRQQASGGNRPKTGNILQRVVDRGYNQLEQKYRQDARSVQANSRRPSLAKERAFRAIVAYRLSHGLPPT